MASSVAVLQACSAVTTSMRRGQAAEVIESATLRFWKRMPAEKPSLSASRRELITSSSRVSMPWMRPPGACALKNRS
jgi:hypothetical protein